MFLDSIAKEAVKILRLSPKIYQNISKIYAFANYMVRKNFRTLYEIHPEAKLYSLKERFSHFFGYYDKTPWNSDGTCVLYHRKRTKKQVDLILYNLKNNSAKMLDTTLAWNWQQGSMLQWWPGSYNWIVYNSIFDENLGAIIKDCCTSEIIRLLPMPIQSVRSDGKSYVSLNYRRLYRLRPDYGYFPEVNNFLASQTDDRDGLWRVDIIDNKKELILTIEKLKNYMPVDSMKKAQHKINHAMYSPIGNRVAFIHRWITASRKYDRLFSIEDDGSELFLLADEKMVSHYSWVDSNWILAYCRKQPWGNGYYLLKDKSDNFKRAAQGNLDTYGDGHPSFSPDGSWIVTDTYPDIYLTRKLLLYNTINNINILVGIFLAAKDFDGISRCDLHPRWSHDGNWISIDSTHSGKRRMYLIDISSIVDER